ncbi:MAG TPA: hypothetical protein VI076_12395 [Actinopolymorphaceae bacterium]
MRLTRAALAVLTAVVTGVGGGAAAAHVANDQQNGARSPQANAQTSSARTPSASTSDGRTPPRRPNTPAATPRTDDPLSEENVIRERLYYDVTGRSLTRVDPDPAQTLGPCTGETMFADVLPKQGVTTIGSKLVGEEAQHAIEQLAQTATAEEARATADEIVRLVDECAAIPGGDFGYGDPETVQYDADRKVVYLPAYDSDAPAGGYIVFAVGNRVGVVDVIDEVGWNEVAHLAKEAAAIAEM